MEGRLTDEQILKIFQSSLEQAYQRRSSIEDPSEPGFTLKDLVGKTIKNYREIKNPRPYNPKYENPNPWNYNVLEFTDGSILLSERWGDGECGHINFYYYDKSKIRVSDDFDLLGGGLDFVK